jgi:HPt (histidine-containing phosphotransfer) domain-containing protein
MNEVLDEQRLRQQLKSSHKRLVRLSGVFFQYYRQQLDDIEHSGGGEALRVAAHTYKGTVSSFAADPLVQLCQQLEKLPELDQELLAQLRSLSEKLRERLEQLPHEEGWNA